MGLELERLTPREREVVEAALEGGSVRSLAEAFVLSPRTVEHHLSSAYRKLGVRNRAELLARLARVATPAPIPVTRYARSGDTHLAYQVVGDGDGDGDGDIVLIPGFVSNVETAWTWPAHARFLARLAENHRLIVFDKRGTGLSDPVADPATLTLEERMDEVRAVMDAAASRGATLLGFSEGAALSMLFAATYPARTDGIVLYGPLISGSLDPGGLGTARVFANPAGAWRLMQEAWGTGQFLAPFAPSAAGDPEGMRHIARFERHGGSPAAAYAIIRMAAAIEVRTLCPVLHTPALILHRRGDPLVPVANSRYLAEHLPAGRYVELEGIDHPPWLGDTDAVLAEVSRFLAGGWSRAVADTGVLLTLLATDLPLNAQALRVVERFRGRPAPSPAGTVYTFDGPVRAAACALALAGGERRIAVHAGEVRHTARGLEGAAIAVVAELLAAASPGEPSTSSAIRDLTLGSGLAFAAAGGIDVAEAGPVDVLRLQHADAAAP